MPNTRFKGKPFAVTIDRSTMERGYVLNKVKIPGELEAQNAPLKKKEFEKRYGFSPEWPHDKVTSSSSHGKSAK